ncbi:MAG: hypothetical protein ACXWQO_06915 [Bdellovibrionota bacterium]
MLLFTSHDFPAGKDRIPALNWAQTYRQELANQGVSAEYFDPYQHKISKSDVVHVFGLAERENWYWLKALAKSVVVSPFPNAEIRPEPSFAGLLQMLSIHLFRRIQSPRSPSLSDFSFFGSVDNFYYFNKSPFTYIPFFKPKKLPQDPSAAAREMSKAYVGLFSKV